MRKIWEDRFDRIEMLLSARDETGRYPKDAKEQISDLREALSQLAGHVRDLSEIVDRVDEP